MTQAHPSSLLATDPATIVDTLFAVDRRTLLLGQPGIGKSTLVTALAEVLGRAGRACWCISVDPGSPHFGVPGAVCLGRWNGADWNVEDMEALCTLDAGRFRLPLVAAVARLARRELSGVVLLDGPGVVRGIAGAELLPALVFAGGIDSVVSLTRGQRPSPLYRELEALPVETIGVRAAVAAQRPGKRARERARTALWEAYLTNAVEHRVALETLRIVGTPPPLEATAAWTGRQVALLEGERTRAMGDVVALEEGTLRLRLPGGAPHTDTLLVRDARRDADGRLATGAPFLIDRLDYLPAAAATASDSSNGGPRVVGRVGMLDVSLVNGVFGDPLLHARVRHAGRSLLFDLGDGNRLTARVAHQVTDVFISHAHFDHIAGFLWLLRSRIGEFPVCRLYGPPGLAQHIAGFTHGVLWDRIEDRGPRFEVHELHGEQLRCFGVQAGRPDVEFLGECFAPAGVLCSEADFEVCAITLDHGGPVLAFAFQPAPQLNVRKDRLRALGLEPGPWLNELKRQLRAGERDAPIALPNGTVTVSGELGEELILVRPGARLVYATDFSDTPDNRHRLIEFAHGAHTFFCEATFLEQDASRAARNDHITTRACGEIAAAAGVARLVPFHFSRRYEGDAERIYAEIQAVCNRVAMPRSMGVFEASDHGGNARA